MATLVDSNISLDGSVSTADKYTNVVDLGTRITEKAAFAFKATVESGSSAASIVLQANADPTVSTTTYVGWFDLRDTDIKIRDSSDGTTLAQIDSNFTGTVNGVLEDSGTYYLEWDIFPARFRLKFKPLAGTDITINYVVSAP